mgnify:CR=1 FL=1
MINFKVIIYLLGFLVLIEGIFMLICAPISAYHQDSDYGSILVSGIITIIVGAIAFFSTRSTEKTVGNRDTGKRH